jgi:hypothetical protein
VAAGESGGWAGADVAQQPKADEHGRKEQPKEQRCLSWSVVARSLDEEDEGGNGDQQQRDDAMEPSGLGMRPRVERADDLPAFVGIRATRFAPRASPA